MKKLISLILLLTLSNPAFADIDNPPNDGSQKTQIVDGSGNVIGATSNALDVNIKSGSSAGTEYTEGDTDASVTGTAVLMEGAANTLLPIQGTVADGLLVNLGANNDVTVSGVSTAANQTTIIGHVDGVEGLLTTIDADTSNISTKIDTLAGAVAGTEFQVDVLTMPTVTVTDGAGALNTIVDSGTLTAVTSITNPVTVTDGAGSLNVIIDSGTTAVTNAGTFATQESGALLTSSQLIDDSIYTDGTGTVTKGVAILGQDGTNPQAIKTDTTGELQVDILTAPTITVTDGAGALNVIVDSSGLPTGAATLAEQQTQTTALQLIDDSVTAQGTALGTTKTSLMGASVTTAAPTYTTGQINPLNMATTGALRVDVGATSANATAIKVNVASGGIASGAIASGAIASGAIAAGAFATGATSVAADEDSASANADRGFKIHQVRLDTPVSGANASGSGDYIPFISDSFGKTWTAGTYAEDLAHTSADAVTSVASRRIDTAASSAGTSGDYATIDSSAEGAVWTTLTPTTTSGLSVANFTSGDTFTALTNTAQAIKASAGNLYGYYIYNPNSSAVYVNLYNVASASVTVGTTTPLMNIAIPATSGANLMFPYPITFSNAGWSASCTTTGGGNTAPSTACEVMFFYK